MRVRMVDPNTISILDFLAKPTSPVSNYQRAIARFRLEPELIPIGAYLSMMQIIADDSIGTAATDCVRKIWYSPKYFDSLTLDQCTSALIHEVQHKFLNFFPRFERWCKQYKGKYSRRQLMRWFNIAQDYFINYMIKHHWNLPIKDTWMYDPKYNPVDHTTESIANELIRQYEVDQAAKMQSAGGQDEDDGDQSSGSGAGDPDTDDADDGEGPDASDAESEADALESAGEAGEGDDTDAGEGDDAGDAEGEDGDGADEGEGEDEGMDDYDPTDPTDSELGEGDDIQLPEEYGGDIEKELNDMDMKSMEIDNRQDMALALRAAKAAKGYDPSKSGTTDPFTTAAQASAFKTGFDFATELARFANIANRKGRYTWYRSSRRLRTSQGIPLPARRGKSIGTCVFVIDSSGSTNGPMVRYFLDSAIDALKTVDYERAVIIWCDDEVPDNGVQEFTKEEAAHWRWDGLIRGTSGGTNFKPAFDVIEERYPDVRCVCYLTDGGVGTYDVMDVAEFRKRTNGVPVLFLLADECGYAYIERFEEWVKEYKAGRCIRLPMDKVHNHGQE